MSTKKKLKRWQVTTDVKAARGCQIWEVEAETAEQACELVDKGEGEFVDQEVEITDVGNAHSPDEV